MTDLRHWRYHLEARAISRAVRHVARGESPERVRQVSPAEAVKWARSHPALFMGLVEAQHREAADRG